MLKQIFYIVLSFNPLPPFNLFFVIKGIDRFVIYAFLRFKKKRKLKFIFMIFSLCAIFALLLSEQIHFSAKIFAVPRVLHYKPTGT